MLVVAGGILLAIAIVVVGWVVLFYALAAAKGLSNFLDRDTTFGRFHVTGAGWVVIALAAWFAIPAIGMAFGL